MFGRIFSRSPVLGLPRLVATLALLPCLGTSAAKAADWYTGAARTKAEEWIVTDASVTGTSHGSIFGSAGVTVGLNGDLQQSGPRAKVEGTVGTFAYTNNAAQNVRGVQVEGGALVGYEWVWRDARLAGLVGLSVRNTNLSIFDPGSPAAGTTVGAKVAVDFYARPTDRTMVSVHGSFTSNDLAYYTRFKAGYRIAENLYVGPEAFVMGNDFYSQWRVGAHLTGLRMGPIQAGISAGYVYDRDQKSGAYGTLDVRGQF